MKEEGQVYKCLPENFQFLSEDLNMIFKSLLF